MSELIPLLNVEDVSRSIAFYRTALDADVQAQWEDAGRVRWARIAFAGGALMLNEPDGATSGDRLGRGDFADAVLYWMCDDAPAWRERLQAAGLDVGELHAEDYGNDEFGLRDPDGYSLRIASSRES